MSRQKKIQPSCFDFFDFIFTEKNNNFQLGSDVKIFFIFQKSFGGDGGGGRYSIKNLQLSPENDWLFQKKYVFLS